MPDRALDSEAVTRTPEHAPQPALRPGRACHLIDAENLNGGYFDSFIAAGDLWRTHVGLNRSDLAVVGTDAGNAITAHEGLPWAALVIGRGPDGADNALITRGASNLSTHRFDSLIIGSGDGAFAQLAAEASSTGIYVIVACQPCRLSWKLRSAAHRVLALPDPVASIRRTA